MDGYPHLYHPENAQFGRNTGEGKFELLNPFKVQQPINTKARRDARLGLYNVSKLERHSNVVKHFRAQSTNPSVLNIYPNEIVWRHRDPEPTTFPEGDIRDCGFTALNGLSPLQFIKPIGVAASGSVTPSDIGSVGMTDFGVTESGLVSMINNSKYDIMAGDYVAAIFPSDPMFTKIQARDDRYAVSRQSPQRETVEARNPMGVPPEKLMAAIVPINRLLNSANPEACPFAASMNGMFVVPELTRLINDGTRDVPLFRCILPTYLRLEFAKNPDDIMRRIKHPDKELSKYCFPPESDIMRMDIWHNFGLGKALNSARSGRSFQCLLGAPFDLPSHEWELSDAQRHASY